MAEMSGTPLVSVLLPSFNYAGTLDAALASVFAQTYPFYEVIAVDDGSTDGSLAVLDKWAAQSAGKMTVFSHPGRANRGIVETYRLALGHARGALISFIEADDIWDPDNLKTKVSAYLSHNGKAGAVYSAYRTFGDYSPALFWRIYERINRAGTPSNRPFDAFPLFLKRNGAATFSGILIETPLFRGLPAPPSDELFFDWWMMAHASARKPFLFLRKKLFSWRIHSGSANFSRFDGTQLKKYFFFIGRLCASLKREPLDAQKMVLLDALEARMSREKRFVDRGSFAGFFISRLASDPLDGSRFLAHVLLKRMLVG